MRELNLKEKLAVLKDDLHIKKFGDSHRVLCDDGPMKDIIYKLHDGLLPNDFIFAKTLELVDQMLEEDFEDLDAALEESWGVADQCVEIYTHDLCEWAKRFSHFIGEMRDELGARDYDSLDAQLMAAQCYQLNSMLTTILQSADILEISSDELN